MSTFVIADGGACHDRDFDKQLRLIDATAAAGCTAYKTQWVSDPAQMARRRGRAAADGYEAVYRRYLAWPADWHPRLSDHCAARGLEYGATVFLPQDVATIAPFVRFYKLASFEAQDPALWAAYKALPDTRRLIASLGMGAAPYPHALDREVRYLHCVSAYPAPLEALQLAVLGSGTFDGFSDHSAPELTWTGALAVAALGHPHGIIEAHLKLDDTDPGNPDAPHAMTPAQFAEYVRLIRAAEVALGTGEKHSQPCEENMRHYRVGGEATHA